MTLPRPPAAVVFDMDGLLFDTEALFMAAFLRTSAAGGHGFTEDHYRGTVGLPWPIAEARLQQYGGSGFPLDAFMTDWRRHYAVVSADGVPLKPGVLALLDTLDALGLPRAIATSSHRATADGHLRAHALTERFHTVVAHGDCAAGKPAPDPYLLAASRLGVMPSLCLALEDSHNGVRSAAAGGMMTVMVPDLLEATAEIAALCSFVARDLFQVREAVLRAHG
jgi:HAD superfamily hydrolase (TIGR01509 family)